LLSLGTAFAQTTKTWLPGNGDWFIATNWVPPGAPGPNDIINITNNTTVNLSAPVTINGQINLASPVIELTGDALTVATNGNLTIGGNTYFYIALTNLGTVTWTNGAIQVYTNGISSFGAIWNQPGALFDIQCDSGMAGSAFLNTGTLRKSATTNGVTGLNLPLVNSGPGQVIVLEGTLNLVDGGPMDGNFNVAAGATLQFGGGDFSYNAVPVFTGPGAVQLAGGTLTLVNDVIPHLQMLGGTVSLGTNFQGGTITNLTLPGSKLSGYYIVTGTLNTSGGLSSGSLFVDFGGLITWTGGDLDGPLTIGSSGGLNIGGNFFELFGPITNYGTINWQSASLYFYNGTGSAGAIWNQPGGLFNIQCDSGIVGVNLFNNLGTLRKSAGPGATGFGVPLLNSGTVQVLQGTLSLGAGGPVDGTFNVSAGAALRLNQGNFTPGAAPILTGAGTFQFIGGTLTLPTDIIPNLQMVGGTVVLGTNFQGGTITNLNLPGSQLSGNYTVTGTFTCGGGLSAGSLLVAPGGVMNWTGNGLSGPLTVSSNAVLNIDSNNVSLYAPLTNSGTVTWQNGVILIYGNGTTYLGAIWNQAGALWDIQGDQTLTGVFGSEQFQNAGTLQKSVGTGTAGFSVALLNSGTVALPQGTLLLGAGLTNGPTSLLTFGISSASSYGQIAASGRALLSGTVSVSLLGGFVPALSNSFALLTYGSSTGLFSNFIPPPIGRWQTNYSATAFTITVTAISKLAFTSPPVGTNAGIVMAPVVVQVEDTNGDPVSTNGIAITLSLLSGAGPLNGTLTQLTDATGKATFNDLSLNASGVKTIQAAAPAAGLASTNATFLVNPGAPYQLVISQPITSPQPVGSTFTPLVQTLDQFGNLATTSVNITARLSSSGGGALAGGTNSVVLFPGSYYFYGLHYSLANTGLAETVVVYFTSPGLLPATNPPVKMNLVLPFIGLQDRNSAVQIQATNEWGMFSWTVDGVSQLFQHWFWVGFGSNAQTSVDHFGTPWGLTYFRTNAVLNYFAGGLSLQLGFNLQGGAPGSQTSALAEQLVLQNITNVSVTAHLFAYTDFDLAGNYSNDIVSHPSIGTIVQQGKGQSVTQSLLSPTPSDWETSFYAITLDNLDGPNPITLSDTFIPLAPGDQTFTFQWDITLAAGQTLVVNLTNHLQPVPIILNIARAGGNILLSWPTNGSDGFQLQSFPPLADRAVWEPVGNPPTIVGDQYQVLLPKTSSAQLYRLQR
jgi:hypothetical protein